LSDSVLPRTGDRSLFTPPVDVRVAGNFTQLRELEGQLVEAKAREQERTAASEAAAATAEATLQTALRAGRRRAAEQAKVN
jgi:hypothetical protein